MHSNRSLRASALLALSIGTLPVFGASYVGSAYDGFNYTAATSIDNTFTLGTGWNATGSAAANTEFWGNGTNMAATGTRTITASSLISPNAQAPASAGGAVLVSGAGQAGRLFGQTIDTGTFYFSFLTQKTIAEVRTVNLSFFNATNERLAIGQIANNVNTRDQDGNWLANAGANNGNFALFLTNSQNNAGAQTSTNAFNGVYVNTTAPVAYTAGTTFNLVGKFEFGFAGGVEDRFTLYINPGNLASESGLIPYLVVDHNDFGSLAGFRMFAGGAQTGFPFSAAIFDELRFGTTYNDVTGVAAVPEPSTYAALVGVAGLAFAALRRRRRA